MDPGQPEFNVSGFLSLVEITKPRYGPNFCFIKKSKSSSNFKIISSYFLGDLSPNNCRQTYIQIIKNMYSDLLQLDQRVPVVFNSMGWLREAGLNLLVQSFKIVKIDFILYLKTNTSQDLPEDLNPERILEPSQITGNNEQYRGNVEVLVDLSKKDSVKRKRKESGLLRDLTARQ